MKKKSYKKPDPKGLKNPIALASLGLTAFSAKDQVLDFVRNYWPWILGLAGVTVGGYYAYSYFNDSNLVIQEDRSLEPTKLEKLDAQNIAESLFKAMSNPGTDEQIIYDLLNGLTYNDFAKISTAFGKRYYSQTLGTEGGSLFGTNAGLFEWLTFELSNDDMKQLEKIIPSVFKIERNLRVGGKAFAKNDFSAHKANQVNGVWLRKGIDQTYKKGDEIGTIKLLITDPIEPTKRYAIVDKPYNLVWDLFIDTDNLEA
jgi:hypothetical protein